MALGNCRAPRKQVGRKTPNFRHLALVEILFGASTLAFYRKLNGRFQIGD
jgi:hypothetical protein